MYCVICINSADRPRRRRRAHLILLGGRGHQQAVRHSQRHLRTCRRDRACGCDYCRTYKRGLRPRGGRCGAPLRVRRLRAPCLSEARTCSAEIFEKHDEIISPSLRYVASSAYLKGYTKVIFYYDELYTVNWFLIIALFLSSAQYCVLRVSLNPTPIS
ncbi:hypothetical protein T492DRAFT_72232 [Pavlovales sp. CCMP2436]|nr:hypothetical protein T492DRAFT_72232 [Pavlovales sp. CCMP2436]